MHIHFLGPYSKGQCHQNVIFSFFDALLFCGSSFHQFWSWAMLIFDTWQKNIFIWWHFTSWVVAGCWSPASYSAQAHWRWTWRLHLRSYCFLFWFQNHLWRTVRAPTIKMKQITTLHCLLPIDMQSKWSQFCEIKVWISIVALVTSRGSEDKAS